MLNGLDLFSGIGGITLALSNWVRPVAYCEIDRYAQAVLLSRMSEGELPIAPIWDDIKTLNGSMLQQIDIIYGGFPCQDISIAGAGKGLEGKRSGLFWEIMRLAEEIKPTFIFLENVPNIRTKGLSQIGRALANSGYDCRWCIVSAEEMGAPHLRKRWFCLGYSKHNGSLATKEQGGIEETVSNNEKREDETIKLERTGTLTVLSKGAKKEHETLGDSCWWEVEPDVGRVVDELSYRVDRIKCLGNAVVPLQARKAFKELIGIKKQQGEEE